jgi:hypothetical protein
MLATIMPGDTLDIKTDVLKDKSCSSNLKKAIQTFIIVAIEAPS